MKPIEATPILTDREDIDRIVAQVEKKPSKESLNYARLCMDVLHNIYEWIGVNEKK